MKAAKEERAPGFPQPGSLGVPIVRYAGTVVAVLLVMTATAPGGLAVDYSGDYAELDGSEQVNGFECKKVESLDTGDTVYSACVDARGAMFSFDDAHGDCLLIPPGPDQVCYHMDSGGEAYTEYDVLTDGHGWADNHGTTGGCTWIAQQQGYCWISNIYSHRWDDADNPICHTHSASVSVYVGGTYDETLNTGQPMPNGESSEGDTACP